MVPKFRVVLGDDGRWLVDVRGTLPDGSNFRRRVTPRVTSKKAAQDYGEALWKAALDGLLKQGKHRATLAKAYEKFWEQHVLGSRLKPSQQASLKSLWRAHLQPAFGAMPLDEITYAAVQAFKGQRAELAPKTVNNALIALKSILRFAVENGMLDKQPKITMLKVQRGRPVIYDIPTFNALVEAALGLSLEHAAVVLLGGECGLRAGEMLALEHGDVAGASLVIQKSRWKRLTGETKGFAVRSVPMTERTAAVIYRLAARKGLLLKQASGKPMMYKGLRRLLLQAQKAAMVPRLPLHALRHTFATDVTKLLGIRAAQGLLGHSEVTTTERYTHLVADETTARILQEARGKSRAALPAPSQVIEVEEES